MKNFSLQILGSGTMMPTKRRHPAAYLLAVGNKRLLLDIGHTTVARLVDLGVDLQSIDGVFVSHFHTDHCADLLPLIHARWVDDVYHHRPHRPLIAIGPRGLVTRWKKLRAVFWREPTEHYPVKFLEGPRTLTLGAARIKIFPVVHVPWFESVGIKILYRDKTLVYSGDIGSKHPIKDLAQVIQNADLLLIEGNNIHPTANHFSLNQIIDISQSSHVKKVAATHLLEANLPTLRRQARSHRHITLARDRMKIDI